MRPFLSLILFPVCLITGFAQGAVEFHNRARSGDAPVSLVDGSGPGALMQAGLYLVRGADLELLRISSFRTSSAPAMHFLLYDSVTVPGVPIGAPATFRLRVWETAAGSYENAVATGACHGEFQTLRGNGEIYVPELGDPDPPGSGPVALPQLDGMLPLDVPCLRSPTNATLLMPAVKIKISGVSEGNVFRFEILTGYPGKRTTLQFTEDLISWTDMSTTIPESTRFTFEVSVPQDSSLRWFRILVEQN